MDAAQLLQTVLAVVQAGDLNATTAAPAASPQAPASGPLLNANAAAPSQGVAVGAADVGIAQLLLMLLSTSAFRDWAKLLLLGAVLEGCRRLLSKSWQRIQDFFWFTATFEMPDDTGDWVLHWAAERKVFNTARHVEITSYNYGLDNSVDMFGNVEDQMTFYPSMDKKYGLWYKGRYVTIMREQRCANSYSRPVEILELRILSRNPRILRDLLIEARKSYMDASQNVISVYVTESCDRWKHVATQQKRPACSVILDPGVFELVLADARDFINSKRWYASRGIPFRRGYLLYGAPGAGKTSMIHSIAGELGLSIYILSLTILALDDNSLKSLIARLPEKCLLLIEDIDAAFHRGMKRDIADPEKQHAAGGGAPAAGEGGSTDSKAKDAGKDGKPDPFGNGVTLSGLLNALDGIAAQEGRILFATTNDYSALDPALLRPGRLDLHVEFQLASRYQARELFKRFYAPDEADAARRGDGDVDEKDDSGYSSANSTPPAELARASESKEPLLDAAQDTTPPASRLPEAVRSAYVGGTVLRGAGGLSAQEAAALAERFADIVPPRAFSMATLQGYLMAYKLRPLDALADAPAWVEKKLREKAAFASEKKDGSGPPALPQ